MINIKILGTGCPKCKTLFQLTEKIIDENNISATIDKIEDFTEIIKYDVIATPALVVNEKVLVKGRVPSKEEIFKLLTTI